MRLFLTTVFVSSKVVIFLPSLIFFADIYLDMCAESLYNVSVLNNTAVSPGSTLRFPPSYSG